MILFLRRQRSFHFKPTKEGENAAGKKTGLDSPEQMRIFRFSLIGRERQCGVIARECVSLSAAEDLRATIDWTAATAHQRSQKSAGVDAGECK